MELGYEAFPKTRSDEEHGAVVGHHNWPSWRTSCLCLVNEADLDALMILAEEVTKVPQQPEDRPLSIACAR